MKEEWFILITKFIIVLGVFAKAQTAVFVDYTAHFYYAT